MALVVILGSFLFLGIFVADRSGLPVRKRVKSAYECVYGMLSKLVIGPFFSAAIALLGVSAGALISLFADGIKAHIPFIFTTPSDFQGLKDLWEENSILGFWAGVKLHVETVGFILSSLLMFLLIWFRDTVISKQSSVAALQLKSSVNDVRSALASVPPYHVLRDFQDSYRMVWGQSQSALKSLRVLGGPSRIEDEVMLAIRANLDAYICLARDWDGNTDRYNPPGVYRSNIMIFRPKEYLSLADSEGLKESWRFSPFSSFEEAFTSIDGVLSLDRNMTTTTETEDPDPDHNIEELTLLVTTNPYSDINIPGAPVAVAKKRAQLIQDSYNVVDECRQNPALKNCLDEISEYYGVRQEGRSILSIPIRHKMCPWDVLGVVNIYRDTPGMFGDSNRMKDFHAVLSPFNFLISELIWEMISSAGQEEFSSAIAANEPLEHNENIDGGGSRG